MSVLIVAWNILGLVIWCVAVTNSTKLDQADLLEWLNPIWIYYNYKVNFFGAVVICVLYNLICPIVSICYWFYKLCTVGRR
jgi:hypothetical protein